MSERVYLVMRDGDYGCLAVCAMPELAEAECLRIVEREAASGLGTTVDDLYIQTMELIR